MARRAAAQNRAANRGAGWKEALRERVPVEDGGAEAGRPGGGRRRGGWAVAGGTRRCGSASRWRTAARRVGVPVEDGGEVVWRGGAGTAYRSASRRRLAAGRMSVEWTGQPWRRAGGGAPAEFRAPARRAASRASFCVFPGTQGLGLEDEDYIQRIESASGDTAG